ncbi:hypothetical protein [Pantoea sp. CCBC3-3-1]|uniref:hypothetical protein n=1 Tax=Pantoea sp. CCBC3-3-1 TaxID=2490851 RepID=UPI00143D1518
MDVFNLEGRSLQLEIKIRWYGGQRYQKDVIEKNSEASSKAGADKACSADFFSQRQTGLPLFSLSHTVYHYRPDMLRDEAFSHL